MFFKIFITLFISVFFVSLQAFSQIKPEGVAPGVMFSQENLISETYSFPLQIKVETLLEQDYSENIPGTPYRTGVAVTVQQDLFNMGQWIELADGRKFFRAILSSPQAKGVSIAFEKFYIPEHAQLFFYSPDQEFIFGGYTHHDNPESMMFPGPVIPGDKVVVEYFEPNPEKVEQNPLFQVKEVAHFYRGVNEYSKNHNIGSSEYCHVNVNCPEGFDWQVEKRSVARMTTRVGNNYGLCTGALINNTAQDGKPYFITAEHCGGSASADDRNLWQFRFNFERPGCDDSGTPPSQNIPGCQLRALGSIDGGSDMQLVELNYTPPPSFQPYYSGWDRSVVPAHSGVGIHHPSGDVKKISTFTDAATSVANPVISGISMASHSAWDIKFIETETDHSVTQGGSSGSPLFNEDNLLVGTLTGGSSSCGFPHGSNVYGKFSYHWKSNGDEPHAQVKHWLDPLETGQVTLAGLDLYPFPSVKDLDANLNEDHSITLNWSKPYYLQGDNWYGYANDYSSPRHEEPERATKFDLVNTLDVDTFYLKKISHLFWEHPQYPWGTNNTFTFKVYDAQGEDLIHESDTIVAANFQTTQMPVVYIPEEPISLVNDFYVAVSPIESGLPSSLSLELTDTTKSYFGTGGAWEHFIQDDKYYELLINVYGSNNIENIDDDHENGENDEGKYMALHTEDRMIKLGPDFANFSHPELMHPTLNKSLEKLLDNVQYYKVYRDGDLIYSTDNAGIYTYTDTEVAEEQTYNYFVTSVYNLNPTNPNSPDLESEKSNEIEITTSFVNLEDYHVKSGLEVYPNPSRGSFSVKYHSSMGKKPGILIRDINGRVLSDVQYTHVGEKELFINLSNYQDGIYFLSVQTGDKVFTEKLIKF